MDWLQPDKIRQIVTTAQTGVKIVSTFNQFRQDTFGGQNTETAVQRSQNELTFSQPDINGSTSQNLHEDFSKEFLKEIVKKSPTLLEEAHPSDGCTPLLCAIKRNDLDSTILLLSHGANVHATDISGNTALHHAVMARSARIVKILLIFRANPNTQNKAGLSANSLKTNNEVSDLLAKMRTYAVVGVTDTKERERANCDIKAKIERVKQDNSIQLQRAKTAEQKANSLRLLSLDGGGIRGLILIEMLMELEDLWEFGQNRSGRKLEGRPGKNFVQRHFDWIAGTSTGAILALALADGTPPIECLRLYLRLKDEIFCSKLRPYNSECIESFLKEKFGSNRKMADLRSGNSTRVFVTATKADQNPIKRVLFRNYPSPLNSSPHTAPDKVPIWKAARCSSAAPTYFSSVEGLMDGGLWANNPGETLLLEVGMEIDLRSANLVSHNGTVPELAFLLSLGTGKVPEMQISSVDVPVPSASFQGLIQTLNALGNLKSILVEQLATSDGQVVDTSRALAHSRGAPYFRLTPSLHTDIQLDTVDNVTLVDMLWNTKIYLREECSADLLALLTLMREFDRTN